METKRCPRCKKFLPISSFGPRKDRKSGLGLKSYCHRCSALSIRRSNEKHRDRQHAYITKYKAENHKKVQKYMRAWERNNKEKRAAHKAVWYALSKGRLQKQSCHCGATQVEAHHPDYSKPLDVIWLCALHHRRIHSQYKED